MAKSAVTLGAGRLQAWATLASETRLVLFAVVAAGWGRVVGEVGISMIVGGNIRGLTRTLTTAVAHETSKGEITLAIALGIILMAIALVIDLAMQALQHRSSTWQRSAKLAA